MTSNFCSYSRLAVKWSFRRETSCTSGCRVCKSSSKISASNRFKRSLKVHLSMQLQMRSGRQPRIRRNKQLSWLKTSRRPVQWDRCLLHYPTPSLRYRSLPSNMSLQLPPGWERTRTSRLAIMKAASICVTVVLQQSFSNCRAVSMSASSVSSMRSTLKSHTRMSTSRCSTRCKTSCASEWSSFRTKLRFLSASSRRRPLHRKL